MSKVKCSMFPLYFFLKRALQSRGMLENFLVTLFKSYLSDSICLVYISRYSYICSSISTPTNSALSSFSSIIRYKILLTFHSIKRKSFTELGWNNKRNSFWIRIFLVMTILFLVEIIICVHIFWLKRFWNRKS